MRFLKSFFLSLVLLASASLAHADKLLTLKGECPGREAVVLVGGFNDDWRHFEPWLEELTKQPPCLFGFSHDHRSTTMSESALALAERLQVLQAAGFDKLTVLAHSMGGLVAKRSLHDLAELSSDNLPTVELKAFGTPWGGYFWANFARWVPGSQALSSALGFPMSAEIGSDSEFLKSLQRPLPASMTLEVYDSLSDEVARPQSSRSKEQFSKVLQQAKSVVVLTDVGHSEFVHKLRVPL